MKIFKNSVRLIEAKWYARIVVSEISESLLTLPENRYDLMSVVVLFSCNAVRRFQFLLTVYTRGAFLSVPFNVAEPP